MEWCFLPKPVDFDFCSKTNEKINDKNDKSFRFGSETQAYIQVSTRSAILLIYKHENTRDKNKSLTAEKSRCGSLYASNFKLISCYLFLCVLWFFSSCMKMTTDHTIVRLIWASERRTNINRWPIVWTARVPLIFLFEKNFKFNTFSLNYYLPHISHNKTAVHVCHVIISESA